MHDPERHPQDPLPEGGDTAAPQPANDRLRELAELEREIRRRLRSNQRFLERFLDEEFVDDEEGDDEEPERDEEEL